MTTWPDGKPKSSGNAFDVPARPAGYAAVREYINRVKAGQASAAATNGGENFMRGSEGSASEGEGMTDRYICEHCKSPCPACVEAERVPWLRAEVKRLQALADARLVEIEALREDAARMRWIAAHCRSTSEHWGGRWSIVVEGPAPKTHNSESDFYAAIDKAIQQGKP